MWERVRSQYTAVCSQRRKRDVTGELSVSYMGVGIKGGSRSGHGLLLSSYHSVSKLIQFL